MLMSTSYMNWFFPFDQKGLDAMFLKYVIKSPTINFVTKIHLSIKKARQTWTNRKFCAGKERLDEWLEICYWNLTVFHLHWLMRWEISSLVLYCIIMGFLIDFFFNEIILLKVNSKSIILSPALFQVQNTVVPSIDPFVNYSFQT